MTAADGDAPVNVALRSFVTNTSFNLSLRRTHIEALIWIDHDHARNMALMEAWKAAQVEAAQLGFRLSGRNAHLFRPDIAVPHMSPPSSWNTSCGALSRRGLVTNDNSRHSGWRTTEAGSLVIALLKEAGLWQEYGLAMITDHGMALS